MEIDSEETWAVINMAACSQERYTYCVSSATWWILGGKRSTVNARHVIYDGSVSTRLMPFGWRIQWDNQHNFLEDQNEYSQKWNKCSMTWNLIQVRNQFADTFHLENPVLICSSSTLNTFQSYRTECEISDHYPARSKTQRIHFSSVCTMLMLTNHLFAINTSFLWVAMVTEFWVAQGRCNNQ